MKHVPYIIHRVLTGVCMAVAWVWWPSHLALLAVIALVFIADLERSTEQELMRKAFLGELRGLWAEVFYNNHEEREQMLRIFDEAMKRRFK